MQDVSIHIPLGKEEDKGVLTEYGQVDAEFRRIDLGKKVVLKIGCFKDIAERQRFSNILALRHCSVGPIEK